VNYRKCRSCVKILVWKTDVCVQYFLLRCNDSTSWWTDPSTHKSYSFV